MLQVGINENLVVSKTVKNDQGSLVIGIKQITEVDPMDILNGSSSVTNFNAPEQDFLIYPPKVSNFDGDPDSVKNVMKKIAELKDPLNLILSQYTTSNNIKWDIFAGTGVAKDNLDVKLTSQDTLDKIYSNIVDQFIKQMSMFVGDNGKKMRMIFIRSSKAKHYPALRKRFLDSQPFIEPMTIPRDVSKLKFSKYEIENGFNVGDAITAQQTPSAAEAKTADALFS